MKLKVAFSALVAAMVLSFALAGTAVAKEGGLVIQAPADSNCFFSNGSPGCDDAECEAIVAAIDPFCVDVTWDSICADEALTSCTIDGVPDDLANFRVNKTFVDNNPGKVEVNLTCTGGLPLNQSFEISEDRGVTFTLESFTDGQPTCTVEEVVPAGYEAEYTAGGGGSPSSEPCQFQGVTGGTSYVCNITNIPVPVGVEVEAVWDDQTAENGLPEEAFASLNCINVPTGPSSFNWNISGDFTFTASVVPDVDGTTVCTVVYGSMVSAVEGSGCEAPISVTQDGGDQSCTITFGAFFEGIPTISQYGMAILVLLMLGIGFVGFRRFV